MELGPKGLGKCCREDSAQGRAPDSTQCTPCCDSYPRRQVSWAGRWRLDKWSGQMRGALQPEEDLVPHPVEGSQQSRLWHAARWGEKMTRKGQKVWSRAWGPNASSAE